MISFLLRVLNSLYWAFSFQFVKLCYCLRDHNFSSKKVACVHIILKSSIDPNMTGCLKKMLQYSHFSILNIFCFTLLVILELRFHFLLCLVLINESFKQIMGKMIHWNHWGSKTLLFRLEIIYVFPCFIPTDRLEIIYIFPCFIPTENVDIYLSGKPNIFSST